MIHLVYGGSGSGKSAYAESQVLAAGSGKRWYVATMQVYGEEGRQKVLHHQQLRAGKSFETVEMPAVTDTDLQQTGIFSGGTVLVECLTNLVANQMFPNDGSQVPEADVIDWIYRWFCQLSAAAGTVVLVSGNVFEDGTSYGEGTVSYMNALGALNVMIAEKADRVTEVVCGIPVVIKET